MSPHNTRDEFRRLLKAENIDTIFRINPVGRIYGVTFIDHNDGIVARRSVLGKEFSANVFNELYPAPKKATTGSRTTHSTVTRNTKPYRQSYFWHCRYAIGPDRHAGL